jgi:hypothetical protein
MADLPFPDAASLPPSLSPTEREAMESYIARKKRARRGDDGTELLLPLVFVPAIVLTLSLIAVTISIA